MIRRSLILLLGLSLASCGPRKPVVELVVAVPLTGDMGTEGRGVRRAVELAVEQANASGRFPFTLAVLALDDRNDPHEAENVANLVSVNPRAAAVIGHYTSGCALAAAPVYARGGIPMLTPSATSLGVTRRQLKKDWPGQRVVFRLVADDQAQGAVAGAFMAGTLKKRRVSVVHDGTPYGASVAYQFARAFAERGGRVLAEERVYSGQRDFSGLVARLKSADGVFFGGVYTEAGVLLKAMRGAGLRQPFVSGDGAHTVELIDVAGEAAEGAYATMAGAPLDAHGAGKAFADAYARRFAAPTEPRMPYDHVAYEAAQLVLDALAKAGPDRAKLLEALRRGRRRGLLGDESFDEKGDLRGTAATMTKVSVQTRSFVAVAKD